MFLIRPFLIRPYCVYIQSKVRGRFRKILWPSQNTWTLIKLVKSLLYYWFILFFQTCSIGFDGSLPIFTVKNRLVVMSHNCPMVLDINFPTKTRAFNGYNHVSPKVYEKRRKNGSSDPITSSNVLGISSIWTCQI